MWYILKSEYLKKKKILQLKYTQIFIRVDANALEWLGYLDSR